MNSRRAPRAADVVVSRFGVTFFYSIFGVNFARADARQRLRGAYLVLFQLERPPSKKRLAFSRKESMCVDVRGR